MALILKRLSDFSGDKASIYTVFDDTDKSNPLTKFLIKWENDYESKLLNFMGRLKSIGNETGALECFFKLHENETHGIGDNVCALYDEPDKEMRLFCVLISEKILVVGGGGPKPSNIRAWQDCHVLSEAARYMILISELIRQNIQKGSLQYSENQLMFAGNRIIQ